MRRVLTALPPALRRRLLLVLPLTGSGLIATGLLLPWFAQVFTDRYLIAGRSGWLEILLAGMAVTALARATLTWARSWVLLRGSRRRLAGTSCARPAKLNRHPAIMPGFRLKSILWIIQRLTGNRELWL